MATPAQITANRANAQSSTGPRSVEGKTASSRNSLKSGLYSKTLVIPGEDPADLEQLTAQYVEEFHPANAIEEQLVETLIRAIWTQQRCDRLEAACLNALIAAQPEGDEHAMGKAVIADASNGDVLTKIFRRREAAGREWTRTLTKLADIVAIRRREEALRRQADRRPSTAPPSPDRVRSFAPPLPDAAPSKIPGADVLNLALRL